MKKLLIALFLLYALAQAQTVQQSVAQLGQTNNWVLTFRWTAASDGTLPVTRGNLAGCCQGYFISTMEVVPGATAPTNGYSVKITDGTGIDQFAGAGSGLSSTVAASFSAAPQASPIQGALNLVVTGNSVSGGTGTVFVFISKPGTLNAANAAQLGRFPTPINGYVLDAYQPTTGGVILPYPSLSAACAAATALNQGLAITLHWNSLGTQSLTGCTPMFLPGGTIQPASGQTLTLPQNVQCPPTQQCYDESLGGTVTFGRPPASISPQNWGADPTGAASATAAWQAAIREMKNSALNDPGGTYIIDGNGLTITATQFQLSGSSEFGTILRWNGAANKFPVTCLGCFHGHVKNLNFQFAAAAPGAVRIQSNNVGSSSQGTVWENINIDGTVSGVDTVTGGVFVDPTGPGGNNNNDFNTFLHVLVSHVVDACWIMKGNQSYGNLIDQTSGCGAGATQPKYAVWAQTTGDGTGPSFAWRNSSMGVSVTGFKIDGCNDWPDVIDNFDEEVAGTTTLINSSGRGCNINIGNFRFFNTAASPLEFFHVANATTLSIHDGTLASIGGNNTGYFVQGTSPSISTFTMKNVHITTTNITIPTFFTGDVNGNSPLLEGVTWADPVVSAGVYLEPTGYTTGTVTATNGSPIVTCAGCTWSTGWYTANNIPGIRIDGYAVVVASIDSPTQLTMQQNFLGSTAAGKAYLLGYGGASQRGVQSPIITSLTTLSTITAGGLLSANGGLNGGTGTYISGGSGGTINFAGGTDSGARQTVPRNTVAGLGVGVEGDVAYVIDSNQTMAANPGAIVTGGGTARVAVFYDGANWRIF